MPTASFNQIINIQTLKYEHAIFKNKSTDNPPGNDIPPAQIKWFIAVEFTSAGEVVLVGRWQILFNGSSNLGYICRSAAISANTSPNLSQIVLNSPYLTGSMILTNSDLVKITNSSSNANITLIPMKDTSTYTGLQPTPERSVDILYYNDPSGTISLANDPLANGKLYPSPPATGT